MSVVCSHCSSRSAPFCFRSRRVRARRHKRRAFPLDHNHGNCTFLNTNPPFFGHFPVPFSVFISPRSLLARIPLMRLVVTRVLSCESQPHSHNLFHCWVLFRYYLAEGPNVMKKHALEGENPHSSHCNCWSSWHRCRVGSRTRCFRLLSLPNTPQSTRKVIASIFPVQFTDKRDPFFAKHRPSSLVSGQLSSV